MSANPPVERIPVQVSPAEYKLLNRLRQLQNGKEACMVILSLDCLALYPVGQAEALVKKKGVKSGENKRE